MFSEDQNYDAKGKYYANCPKCGLCVEEWDGRCPDCGTGMDREESRFYFLNCKTCGNAFQVNTKIYEGVDKATCPKCGGVDIEERIFPKVKKANAKTASQAPKIELFPFNPNTADVEQLKRLGLNLLQRVAVCSFRSKGGVFKEKSDFYRVCWSSFPYGYIGYERLEPYIIL